MSEKTETAVERRQPQFSELDPWNRWAPLRTMMDQFFGERSADWPIATGVTSPRVDITENEHEYRVRAELPGVSKQDVTVEFEQGVLSIRGEKKSERDEKTEKGRRLECSYGTFSRSFSLPQDANPDQISAEFANGVLDVKVKKSPESKPKQIAVKG